MKAHSAIFESESVFKNLFFKLEFESMLYSFECLTMKKYLDRINVPEMRDV